MWSSACSRRSPEPWSDHHWSRIWAVHPVGQSAGPWNYDQNLNNKYEFGDDEASRRIKRTVIKYQSYLNGVCIKIWLETDFKRSKEQLSFH